MIIPRSWRYEIGERIDNQGNVLKEIDKGDLDDLITRIESEAIESVAICLLFSFLYPEHEQQIARNLRKTGLFVSLSSEVLPEYREYERTSTTVLNAYVSPIIDAYLGSLETSLTDIGHPYHLRIMQSNGGIINVNEARRTGVRCIVSGPAGGVVGASYIGQAVLADNAINHNDDFQDTHLKMITFDMGGTSTDVSLIDQQPSISTESVVGGFPIGIPMLDVHTIGAGGGSIARVDLGGALRVGPESAGAEPGPACYARGDSRSDLPTVTDANVVLGRLPVDHFLGGEIQLDKDRAFTVMEKLGAVLGMDAIECAQGVIEVINAHMERALRLVTIERGNDPEEFVLLSFGGAGGLHAVQLARRLSIPKVIVPPVASTLSAYGMLVAEVIKDYSLTVMFTGGDDKEKIDGTFQPLFDQGRDDLLSEDIPDNRIRFEPSLDMRYRGQSYELNIPFRGNFLGEFHRAHEIDYGHAHPGAEVEIVNIRLRAVGITTPPEIPSFREGNGDSTKAILGYRPVVVDHHRVETPIYQGELLSPGDQIEGPAVVARKDTTIYLPMASSTVVDRFLNQVISFTE
jgi:N-methylhydantoinase A